MASYLENYLSSINSLPPEIKRNFKLMLDLDKKASEITDQIEGICNQYKPSKSRGYQKSYMSEEEVDRHLESLQDAVEWSEEKVRIANQTYQMVDKHIRKLDQDLLKFKEELELEKREHEKQEKQYKRAKGKIVEEKKDEMEVDIPAEIKQEEVKPVVEMSTVLPEVPIDPNEPVYCLCRRISFGEMIGCDNDDCKYEWFHFPCVGLTAPVQGKWYCPICVREMEGNQ
eukprot:TRINITY_DN2329_c0_g1_i1.p1 TRINITY_DN2329_c0_g1~~TRINITY_DN2329_c0_g1_i1.p1  ORF type:complete len:228 (+),score=60.17 TRINITY_DN2329_c0_g1_i1:17-700(+)